MAKTEGVVLSDGRSYFKKILLFSLPIMLTGVLQTMYNAADLIVVGRFEGEIALAAVGSTGSLTSLILGLFMGLSVGAGVCVAHGIGARKEKEVQKTLHTSILVAFILGVIVGVVGFFLAPQMLHLMGTPDDVIAAASLYVRIIFVGAPASVVYNYAAAMLRASGDSKRPLIFLTVSGLINVALNLLLVIVFRIGVVGVAVGTIASQYASAAMILLYLRRLEGSLHLSFRKLKIHRSALKKVLIIGIPSGVQGTMFSLSNVIIQSSINSFGSVVMAGNAAAANVEAFYYIAYHSFYDAALTFVGQNVGAKRFGEIKKIMISSAVCVLLSAVVLISVGLIFEDALLGLYIDKNTEAFVAAKQRFTLIMIPYFLCGFMEIVSGTLRGMGRSISSAVISLTFACAFRIVWIATVFKAFPTPECIYVTYPITWVLTMIAGLVLVLIAIKKEMRAQAIYDIQYKAHKVE